MKITEVLEVVKETQKSAELAEAQGKREAVVVFASYIRGLFQSTTVGERYEDFVPSYLEFLTTATIEEIQRSIENIIWALEQEVASTRRTIGFGI